MMPLVFGRHGYALVSRTGHALAIAPKHFDPLEGLIQATVHVVLRQVVLGL